MHSFSRFCQNWNKNEIILLQEQDCVEYRILYYCGAVPELNIYKQTYPQYSTFPSVNTLEHHFAFDRKIFKTAKRALPCN